MTKNELAMSYTKASNTGISRTSLVNQNDYYSKVYSLKIKDNISLARHPALDITEL